MKQHIYKLLLIGFLVSTNISCEHLKKHEIAKIHFTLFGDFGSEISDLTLFDVDGLIKAKLEIKDDTVYMADVDQQGLDNFNSFVNELKSVKKVGYCTTHLSFTVHTKSETIEKKQVDCGWNGFEYLKGSLFKGQGIGKVFRYEEKIHDSTIKLDFSIRYGNYAFYFNVPQVSAWCDEGINSKGGLGAWYKSIKQEVNHEPVSYGADNHTWLMTFFTPRIINENTKEEGKSLLIKHNDTLTADRTYFVITPHNDTIRLFGSDRNW